MKNYILISLFTMLTASLFAQKAPIKYGKPKMEDLKKTMYKIDTTAPAVILCNYGYFNSDKFLFTQIVRIKILKKEGYSWANWNFQTLGQTNVRGKTFNLIDGKIVSDKLNSKSIFREEVVKNYYETKIAMPNVKIGSVIDIEVTYSGIPLMWYFQKTIPVLYSELVMEPTDYLSFRKNYFGYIAFDITSPYRWVTKNVPAFQKEPFMAPIQNYLSHFEYDITSIHIPGEFVESFANTWKDVNTTLDKFSNFGGALKGSGSFFGGYAKAINSKYTNDEDKVKAAMALIHEMHWNGKNRLFDKTGATLKYYFNKKEGSSAEINLALIRLLDKIGFEVYPVILRTRNRGHLSAFTPTIRNLNYVLAYAKINGKFFLIDGTDKNAPYYILPDRCLNEKGRISSKDTSNWVALTNNIKESKRAFYMLTLNKNDLSLNGSVQYAYKGYGAYNFRKAYRETGSREDYIYKLTKSIDGLTVLEDTLINMNNIYQPVKEKAKIVLNNQCFTTDSLIYLTVLPNRIIENPFKQEKRKYPIDFKYPKSFKTTVIITLPNNFQPVKIPASKRMKLPNNDATFTYAIAIKGNKLMLNYSLKINKSFFIQTDYQNLKAFYMQAINKESEPVLLKSL